MSTKPNSELQEALDAFLSASAPPARPVTPLPATPPAPASAPAPSPVPASTGSATGTTTPAAAGTAPTSASVPESSEPGSTEADPGKQELLAAYHRLVEHEANKPTAPVVPKEPVWKKVMVPAIGVVSVVATLYLWIAQPAWLYPRFEPVPSPTTPGEAEQQLIAASILVEQYHRETGQLPVDFAAIGLDASHMGITSEANGGYRIMGGTAAQPMVVHGVPGQRIVLEAFPR